MDRIQRRPEIRIGSMVVGGKPTFFDPESYDLAPGDRAVILRHDGTIAVSCVENYRREGAAARAALEPLDDNSTKMAVCTIIGRVIEATLPY